MSETVLLSDTILAAIIGTTGAIFGSIITLFSLWWQSYLQNKNSNLADIRHKREDVYIKALGISLYKISLDESEESKKNNELITSKVYEIAPLMMVYASKKVLILYKQIQKVAEDGYSKVVEGRLFDRLESEIRRELDVDD